MFKTLLNRLLLVVVLFNLCAVIGCHRGYYRRQADAEAQRLIRENLDPRWDSSNGTIVVDPQSRMFDPFSADHPPIPPDDASSHQFMHRVDGKEGYPQWHADGDTEYVASPVWRQYLPVNEEGQVVLTLDRAYRLALIHSPLLQQQRETLYLSALDVSLERFGFDSQLFTGYNTFFTTQGRLRDGSGRSSSTLRGQIGANGGGLNLEKLGTTGTNFAVGLANTILFNFAGQDTQSATSLIDFSLIQPLLRSAGRERIMESLTQSERTLLANVRQLERFRSGFYLLIAIGRSAGAGPNRSGGFLGLPGAASSNAGGFIGLLELQQQIRNQKLNVRQLESVLELFREYYARDRLDAVQLKGFETNVYGQQRRLLELTTQYQTQLDRFKISLGLPPELDVVIEDDFLKRFNLISDNVNERLISIGDLRKQTGTALNQVDNLFDKLDSLEDLENGKFLWPSKTSSLIEDLVPYLDQAEQTLASILDEDRKEIESDFDVLEVTREARVEYLDAVKAAIASKRIDSSIQSELLDAESIQDPKKLRERMADMASNDSILSRAADVKAQIEDIKSKIANLPEKEKELSKPELFQYIRSEFQERIPGQLSELNNLVLEISLLQALARSNSIEIIDVSIESEQAITIARCMRRDWMNARASLVDSWRNIDFVADQLEAQIDLVFEGDIGNTGDNPFKLRYETGQLRAGLRFDAPITRLAERNRYRAALIDYQQSRRQYYQFEDSVKRNLREIVRNLDRNKILFELNRRAVQVDIESVEINRYKLEEPVGPNAGAGGGRLGSTTALNLTNAIIGLNSSQNAFLGSWVEYEVLRRNLDFDMGTMQLDPIGDWVDPGKIDSSIGINAANTMGIELDCQFCQGVTTFYSDDGSSNSVPESGAQDQSLPYESNSNPESNSIIQPVDEPSEVEGVIIPQAPSLNEPETGMRERGTNGSRTSDNQAPSHLFTPVQARARSAVKKSWSAEAQPELNSKSIVEPVANGRSAMEAAKKKLTKPLAPKADLANQTAASEDTVALVANRIAEKFNDQGAMQATRVTPVDSASKQSAPGKSAPGKSTTAGQIKDTVESEFRPIPPMDEEANELLGWQSENYSLGKALERFRSDKNE